MRFKVICAVFGMFFASGLVFLSHFEASGHDNDHGADAFITAGEVDITSEADVKNFLNHIVAFYSQFNVNNPGVLTIFDRELRLEGDYKHSATNMYSISINSDNIVTNHAGHPSRFGYHFDPAAQNSAVVETINTLISGSGVGMTKCSPYGGEQRVACAVKVPSPSGTLTIIAGLHHEENDPAFKLPECEEFNLPVSAEDVYDDPTDDTLKDYVQGVIGVLQREAEKVGNDILSSDEFDEEYLSAVTDPRDRFIQGFINNVSQRLLHKVACYGGGDFKHENIYIFMMGAAPSFPFVFFNGNNSALNGTTLSLSDDSLQGEKNIALRFNQALVTGGGVPPVGESAYVDYHWDDPTIETDNVANFLEEGKVPGTSCKRSYIEVMDLNKHIPGSLYLIFGSGTYGACGGEEDDNGCSIAGVGNTPQSILLNLLLAATVLFSAVFLKKRA